MSTIALTELLGAPVVDSTGAQAGRVRELALTPQEDRQRISMVIVKTSSGSRLLPAQFIMSLNGGVRARSAQSEWASADSQEGMFLLARDLLDQQVIDVFGRKVVRVNDVDLHQESHGEGHLVLKVGSVDVGPRGAVRRLLKGVVPMMAMRTLLKKIPPRNIPWDFVDIIETDPARRVKLKISNERLAKLHPADIADIVEELAPDEREAVFEILLEMEPKERAEMVELLEFRENTAAGRMTTTFLALDFNKTNDEAIEALRNFEGGVETVNTIYLVDSRGTLVGAVPLVNLVLAKPETPLLALAQEPLISTHPNANETDVSELFDKYNLLTLPVVDDHNKLTGVITSDDVISLLRSKL
jgi:magnesium transporter